ncbi:uncharacterized protein LOC129311191 isoform X2 [Prosopis cineraria]|uniref:uncharacterized protein LOC129311191 isoform X2 n=1 Tax=Prosopis cineraria TaxID=364024 RepID=UPI00240FED32|nr:uncharacterized protein LOC129311191 isoform X2 [Prosopis cineraria]XP_054809251.1 uncharacterized protein LOC129311191 isoform X2 [Prosopis cineraria]XP_054809252.1 uncharacterized protein LOC129311191 isoform X2 [Prosopis cineraria]
MEDKGKHDHGGSLNNSENPISESPIDRPPTGGELTSNPSAEGHGESTVSFNQSEIFRAIQVVERDSLAIAESFVSLFDSLRLALSEVTGSSVDHMQCFCDATGRLQESGRDPCEVGLSEISLLEATTKGNRYINSCLSGGIDDWGAPLERNKKREKDEQRSKGRGAQSWLLTFVCSVLAFLLFCCPLGSLVAINGWQGGKD